MTQPESSSAPVPLSYDLGQGAPTRFDIAVIGLRLLGVYALLHALPLLAMPFMVFDGSFDTWQTLWYFVTPSAHAAAGVLLLFQTSWLAARILPRGGSMGAMAVSPSGRDYQAIAFSVVGLIVALLAVADLAEVVLRYMPSIAGGYVLEMEIWGPAIIQFALGVILFFQGPGLANLWSHLRTGGVRVRPLE